MIFSEMFQTKLNAMVYSRCMWNTEGKNRMQLMKGHMTVISPATKVRYDLCIFESNPLPFEQVNIPVVNGNKMFELDQATYSRISGAHFYFLEVVSNNQPLVMNQAFSTLEEAQKFALSYRADTRGLDVMFKHMDPQAAGKLPPQPSEQVSVPTQSQPRASQESAASQPSGEEQPQPAPQQSAQNAGEPAGAERPAAEQRAAEPRRPLPAPINMTAYDRFCLNLDGISKRDLVRFFHTFYSARTKSKYDAYVLQSRSKEYAYIVIPEANGKPVVEIPEAAYGEIQDRQFYFIEFMESGRTLVPNIIFESEEDAKSYLYNYQLDTRGLDVMFRKMTNEEAAAIGRQPSADPVENVPQEAAAEEAAATAVKSGEEETQKPEERKAEEPAQDETQRAEAEPVQEEAAASTQEVPAERADNEDTVVAAEAEDRQTEKKENTAEEEAAQAAAEAEAREAAARQEAEEKEREVQEAERRKQAFREELNKEPVKTAPAEPVHARSEEPLSEVMTPPVSMAVYSRFCLDTSVTEKHELYRYSAEFISDYSKIVYEINVVLGKSKPFSEVQVPEVNGRKLFDLPEAEYNKLAGIRFYFIEVTSGSQTTVLNKIFTNLDAAKNYIAGYEKDIRELDVMFRKISPQDAAKAGKMKGSPYVPEKPVAAEETKPQEPAAACETPEENAGGISGKEAAAETECRDDKEEQSGEVRSASLFEGDDDAQNPEGSQGSAESDEDVEFIGDNADSSAEEVAASGQEEARESECERQECAEQDREQDKIVVERKDPEAKTAVYNQPIYAKEVYIQFPNVTSAYSSAAEIWGKDPFFGENRRDGFEEVDFERYFREAGLSASDDFKMPGQDGLFGGYEAEDVMRIFGEDEDLAELLEEEDPDEEQELDKIVSELVHAEQNEDPYEEVMKLLEGAETEGDIGIVTGHSSKKARHKFFR